MSRSPGATTATRAIGPSGIPQYLAGLWADRTLPTGPLAGLGAGWRGVRIGINAANLLDKDYLITQDGFTCRGEGRSVIGTLRLR